MGTETMTGRPDPRLPASWCGRGVTHDHGAYAQAAGKPITYLETNVSAAHDRAAS